MALIIQDNKKSSGEGKTITPVAPGLKSAVCYGVWDVGLQPNTFDDTKGPERKIVLGFELDSLIPDEGKYQGKRHVLSLWLKVSYYEKSNLMKHFTSWFGKAPTNEQMNTFDWESLVGRPAYIQVVEGKSGKPAIGNVLPLPDGIEALVPENPSEAPDWVAKIASEQITPKDDLPFD